MVYGKITYQDKGYYVTRSIAVDQKMKDLGIDITDKNALKDIVAQLRFVHACMESGCEYAKIMGMDALEPPTYEEMLYTLDPGDVHNMIIEMRDMLFATQEVRAKEPKKKEVEA